MNRSTTLALTLALVPTVEGSRSVASRIFVPAKASALAKTLAAPKQTSKEPIAFNESAESSLEKGTRVAPLDVPPL